MFQTSPAVRAETAPAGLQRGGAGDRPPRVQEMKLNRRKKPEMRLFWSGKKSNTNYTSVTQRPPACCYSIMETCEPLWNFPLPQEFHCPLPLLGGDLRLLSLEGAIPSCNLSKQGSNKATLNKACDCHLWLCLFLEQFQNPRTHYNTREI